jgi:hypothetical protein
VHSAFAGQRWDLGGFQFSVGAKAPLVLLFLSGRVSALRAPRNRCRLCRRAGAQGLCESGAQPRAAPTGAALARERSAVKTCSAMWFRIGITPQEAQDQRDGGAQRGTRRLRSYPSAPSAARAGRSRAAARHTRRDAAALKANRFRITPG